MILIALGSNLGDREATLREALKKLEAAGVHVTAKSGLMETPALLPQNAPADWDQPFLNQVVAVETSHTPEALLDLLKAIEVQMGRAARSHWAPRELDLDLLAYHDTVIESARLTLPHPHMQHRRFVLAPLVEIAPDWTHPVLRESATQLLAALPA